MRNLHDQALPIAQEIRDVFSCKRGGILHPGLDEIFCLLDGNCPGSIDKTSKDDEIHRQQGPEKAGVQPFFDR